MSPRPPASRHDATARNFLDAAADLIDAYLQAEALRPEQSARLRQIRFPAALEWLRVEDVIRLARSGGGDGVSRKAFFNRWPTKDDFLADAVVHAAMREHTGTNPTDYAKKLCEVPQAPSLSVGIAGVADALLDELLRHPRNFITLHLGPLLPQHPRLWKALLELIYSDRDAWIGQYEAMLNDLGLTLRPEWTSERVALVLQILVDGFVLRSRVEPAKIAAARDGEHTLLADTIVALALSVIDWGDGRTAARADLDERARTQRGRAGEVGKSTSNTPDL